MYSTQWNLRLLVLKHICELNYTTFTVRLTTRRSEKIVCYENENENEIEYFPAGITSLCSTIPRINGKL